jgi:hypothetical protein
MAGKRPDQHNIAPSEAGSTDYKRYPEATHGPDGDLEHFAESDKQRLAQSRKEGQGQPFLPDVPSPSAEANRGTKIPEEQPGAAQTESGKENPLV